MKGNDFSGKAMEGTERQRRLRPMERTACKMSEQKKISCIALDLDGTTLKDDKQISERNRKAIEDAVSAGVSVVIASGRSFSSLPESVTSIPGIEYAVTSNGAAVYRVRDGVRIHKVLLEPESVDEILRITGGIRLGMEAFIRGIPYAQKDYIGDPVSYGAMPYAVSYIQSTRRPVENIREYVRSRRKELDGIDLIVADEEKRKEIREALESARLPLYVTSSVKNRVETAAQGAGKAEGLRFLQKLLGIPREETAAFGDADNDIDMLRAAGFSFAMENASPGCRAAADFITKTNQEDGVAFGIYEVLGIPESGAEPDAHAPEGGAPDYCT